MKLLCKHRWTYKETIISRHKQWGEEWEDYEAVKICQWCGYKVIRIGARKIEAAKNERPNK